jgi:biotin carboxylase
MERVLLLMSTTTYKAGAYLDAAQRLRLAVTVGTDRPQALGEANPAGHLTLDFADHPAAAGEIVAFSARHPIRAILAADDDGVELAARAAEAMGLAHHPPAAVRAARDKLATRRSLAAAGLPVPWFEPLYLYEDPASIAARLRYPCVIKPLALAGSRGVMRADDPPRFIAAFGRLRALLARADARPERGALVTEALVEGYLPGAEVALEGLVTGGRLRALAIFDKPDPLEGPFFEETMYITPSRLPGAMQRAVAAAAQAGVAALGLAHGPVHAELRIHQGQVWVLEIAPRTIGGLCSRALRFGADVSLEELILRHALGQEVSRLEREKPASGVMMIPIPARGRLDRIEGLERARAVPGVTELRITIPIGQPIEPLPEGARYLGFIFARGAAPDEAETALREAHRNLLFAIQPIGN